MAAEIRARPGDRVRVSDGIFEGVEGIVVEPPKNSRVIVHLDLEHAGVSLEINTQFLELIRQVLP